MSFTHGARRALATAFAFTAGAGLVLLAAPVSAQTTAQTAAPSTEPAAVSVQRITPAGEVPAVRQVVVKFSADVVALGDPSAGASNPPYTVRCEGGAGVAELLARGSGRWLDASQWVFDLPEPLPAGSACTVSFRAGWTPKAGTLQVPAAWREVRFATGAPTIARAEPPARSTIEEGQHLLLHLTGPVTADSVRRQAWCEVQGLGERIPVTVVQGAERDALLRARQITRPAEVERTLLVACARPLPPEARVQFVWGAGIASAARPAVVTRTPLRLAYTVRKRFTAEFSCERERAGLPCLPLAGMTLRFSAPVPRALALQVRLTPAAGAPGPARTPVADDDGAPAVEALSFAGPFPESARFTLTLPAALRDDAGRTLANAAAFPLAVATGPMPPLAKPPGGAFGIVEATPDAALPITLRRVQRELRGATADGVVRVKRVDDADDADLLRWLGRLERDRQTEWASRAEPMLEREAGVQRLALPPEAPASVTAAASAASAPPGEPTEVVGLPMPQRGYHVVEVASRLLGGALLKPAGPMYVRTGVLVTNLGVHVKRGRTSSLVWVTTLDRAKPVADAEVRVSDCLGRRLWTGRTDAQGLARIAQPLADATGECPGPGGLFVSARTAARDGAPADLAFVSTTWDRGIESWRFELGDARRGWSGDDDPAAPRLVVHSVLDRSLLRTGETLSMKHFVRRQVPAGLAPAPADARPDELRITHLGSGSVVSQPLAWSADGRHALSTWAVPAAARLGEYELTLHRGARQWTSGRFRVEAFRVPLVDARLSAPPGPLVAPKSLALAVQLAALSGGGLKQDDATLSAVLRAREPGFAGFEALRFAPPRPAPDRAGTAPEAFDETGVTVADRRPAPTDARGAGQVTLDGLPALRGPSRLQAELSFSDPNGEIQTVQQSLDLWPAAVVVGVGARAWVGERQQVSMQAVVLDTAGKPLAGRAVTVSGRAWRTLSSRQRLVGGFYAWDHREEVRDLGTLCEGRTDAQGRIDCTVAPRESGEVELVARAVDDAGRASEASTTVWLAGAGELWFAQDADDRIDLLPERRELQPGDTARLQVRMPYRQATVLVTVEREGVLDARVLTLRGSDPVIEVPIPKRAPGADGDSWAPNVVVGAFVLRGRVREVPWYSFFQWGWSSPAEWWSAWRHEGPAYRAPTATVDLGRPSHKMGLAALTIGRADHRLDVQVRTDRPQYAVRQTARVSIEVSQGGRPVPGAQVAFAAVDEGLLALKPNDSWALLEGLMPVRPLEVDTATAQGEVIGRRHFGRKALPAGGGGGRNPTRELFDTLLLWRGVVTLDASGRATVDVPLNDSLTSFRFVAVADAGADRFGTGQATARVTQDLQLLPGWPLVLREGDRFTLPVTLRNTTGRAMSVQAALQVGATGAPGASAPALPAFAPQTVALAAGAAAVLNWEVAVPTGATALQFEAQARDVTAGAPPTADRIRRSVPVQPAVPVQVLQATLAPLDGSLTLPVAPPLPALPAGAGGVKAGGVSVALQPTLAGGLPGVQRWFAAYPYNCLEQRASRALALDDAAQWAALMNELPGYLDGDGLALYFPPQPGDPPRGSDRLTAHLLAIAHDAGRALPDAPRDAMLRGLAAWVDGRIERRFWAPRADDDVRRLAALAALARHGRAEARMLGTVQWLPERWPTAALLDAIEVVRRVPGIPGAAARRAALEQLLRGRLDVGGTTLAFSDEAGDTWPWLMDGPDANAARLLLTMREDPAWRDDLPRLMNGTLARQRGGAWFTTVANAWGAVAMRRFAETFERGAVTGRSSAQLGSARWSVDWPAPGAAAPASAASAGSPGAWAGPDPALGTRLPWPAGATPDAPATLTVQHTGTGRPWLTVQALAAVRSTGPVAAGYRLQRSLVPVQQQTPGRWRRGDVVRVRLEVEAVADMAWVVIDDPVPAGAAVLGSGLGRDSALATGGERREGGAWIAFEERRADAWRAYAEYLPRGRHVFEYTLRLNTPGRFLLPDSRVEAMYAPDRHGTLPVAPLEIAP